MPVLTRPDGVRLYHELHGHEEAPPLILLEGMGGDIPGWRRNIPVLAGELRVIAYDFRGNGNSDEPSGPATMATFVDDTLALLDALGVDRAHVYGQSFGGMVAQEMALTRPERVRTLILGCTHAGPRHAVRVQALQGAEGGAVAIDVRAGVPRPPSRSTLRRISGSGLRSRNIPRVGGDNGRRCRASTASSVSRAWASRPSSLHGTEDLADLAREREAARRADPRRRAGACSRAPVTCTTRSRPRRPTPPSWTSSGGTGMPEAPDGSRPAGGGARRCARIEGLRQGRHPA